MWEKTDGCAEQYICASALYLMSVISQTYSIIIDWGIIAPGHGKEVVDGLNAVDKRYIAERVLASFANQIQSEYYGADM